MKKLSHEEREKRKGGCGHQSPLMKLHLHLHLSPLHVISSSDTLLNEEKARRQKQCQKQLLLLRVLRDSMTNMT